jgi:hypothetical protein
VLRCRSLRIGIFAPHSLIAADQTALQIKVINTKTAEPRAFPFRPQANGTYYMIVTWKRGFARPPQPRSRKFFVDCQDRILLGPGSELEEAMYANYFRWPETGDEYLPTGASPARDDGKSMGWNCPIRFLKRSIRKNADKIFAQSKGSH